MLSVVFLKAASIMLIDFKCIHPNILFLLECELSLRNNNNNNKNLIKLILIIIVINIMHWLVICFSYISLPFCVCQANTNFDSYKTIKQDINK